MKGYKASYNQKCKGFFYEVGKTYKMKDKPICCQHGFHFCQDADDVIEYYPYDFGRFVLFEVNAHGDIHTIEDKSCTNEIEIVRIIPYDEYNKIFKNYKFDDIGSLVWYKNGYGQEYEREQNGFKWKRLN
jgi:hypothetical protein